MKRTHPTSRLALLALLVLLCQPSNAQSSGRGKPPDSTSRTQSAQLDGGTQVPLNLWGIDLLLSNGGFGLGATYRRQYTEDLAGQVSLTISESKEDQEVEVYDPYTGTAFTPGKLNRFLVIPLTAGVQYRLFREDIVGTFRPYVNGGLGPAMIYTMPFVDLSYDENGRLIAQPIEFFNSIGKGQADFTFSAFLGVGAYFGSERASTLGLNLRYYFTYLFSDGIPSQYNPQTGEVTGYKDSFGGFFITINIGMAF